MIREEREGKQDNYREHFIHIGPSKRPREISSCFPSLSSLIIALFLQYSRLLGLVR